MLSRHAIVLAAGLLGAAGVALAAVAAHRVDDPALATGAHMLLLHATAAVAVSAHLRTVHHRPVHHHPVHHHNVWVLAAILLLAGSAVFAGDITMRALTGSRLFPMAAPTGGTTMIGGWLVLAVAAGMGLRRRPK